MRKSLTLAVLFLSGVLASQQPAGHVNPFIGTGGHGHTFPGAAFPFGMIQLSPDTRVDGSWDGCAGYHYSDSVIYGFSHTHLSGTGCSDFGDILLMPTGKRSVLRSDYRSGFSHQKEKASAGYYEVELDDEEINVRLTTGKRVGMHEYEWKGKEKYVVFDLGHRDKVLPGSYVKIVSSTRLEGLRRSEAWAGNQNVYFAIEFSRPFEWEVFMNDKSMGDQRWIDNYYSGEFVKVLLNFSDMKADKLTAKVSISSVDVKGAWNNMISEVPGFDFDLMYTNTAKAWNDELSRIHIVTADKDQLAVFYTALYHCMIHPSLASDADGRYRGMDKKIYTAEGFDYYHVFSLWDTFRSLHPLLTLIDRKRTSDFIKTFLEMYKQTKRLPVWELASCETECMIGYHAVSVIADAYMKGIRDFDVQLALDAMVAMSNLPGYRGIDEYKEKGFLETHDESENVSKTLEYAYNDWCISVFARAIGKEEIYLHYLDRSHYWKNIFNPATGFMQPRQNGGWLTPFDPYRVDNNYTEANSWQYSFFVPHDPAGLINAHGGDEEFLQKLNQCFHTNRKTTGREQADISGLIGQYAHGNEPSHHMTYFYNYAGQPSAGQKWIRKICTEFYKNAPDGLIGNEDCGQMSAWYVMSALGFYSFCPGSPVYAIGSPLFSHAEILISGSNRFTIRANNNGGNTPYVAGFSVNGKPPDGKWEITHEQILKGGELNFSMTSDPGKVENGLLNNGMISYEGQNPVPVPAFSANGPPVFRDSLMVTLTAPDPQLKIWYRLSPDLSKPALQYKGPFKIYNTQTITAYSETANGSKSSKLVMATFSLHPHPEWKIEMQSEYNPQYTAGGPEGIIDGIYGDLEWRKGGYQGYQGKDMCCIIDLGSEKEISEVALSFLEDARSWIYFPREVIVEWSPDGKTYGPPVNTKNTSPSSDMNLGKRIMTVPAGAGKKVRYVRIKVVNYGKLPPWHLSAGQDAFIFIDEILIR
ncbi:MAG: GH92 family glycosyl hydrolase [Bacteroidia bacterium]|nr:GH92 family glycosyl hydrolase [Bacteroidia bacterium]